MTTLTEQSITAEYTGKLITADPLPKWLWKKGSTGNRYAVYFSSHLADDKSLREQFGITERLRDTWLRRGTEFSLYLTIEDKLIKSCSISKENDGDGARPSGGGTLKPTPQELRLVIRILNHLTTA